MVYPVHKEDTENLRQVSYGNLKGDRHYSKQSYVLVNAKYALTRNEIDLILTLLTEIKKEDKDFQDYIFSLKDLEFKTSKKWHSKQLKDL